MGLLLVRMRSHNRMGTPPTIVADRICTGGDQRHETPPVAPASRFRGAVCPIRQAESKVVLIMSNILDSFRLDNKVALVTGSAGGMGAAIAIALAQAGAAIATHDIRPPAAPEALFKQVLDKFGRVDILVNNAGIILREDAVNVPLADWLKVIQINETAVFQLSQLAGRDMISRNAPGKIISIASLLSFQGGIRVPSYAAAKGAVAQITKALANEWAVKGIQVNAIA